MRREIDIYVKPVEMETLGIGIDQVISAVRNENQELPSGAIRSSVDEKVVQIQGRVKNPEDFGRIIVARRSGQPVLLSQIADVVDGLQAAIKELTPTMQALYPGVKMDVIRDSSRQIRVGVENVRRTLLEGAVLTVLIVFLFLNSWRSTVITGLTLPVALMALSLCVGLLIDDAIVVRENIVRHAGMKVNGRDKDHKTAALEGTAEIGLAVMATTFSIVAVFLPVGFMGGIIGR